MKIFTEYSYSRSDDALCSNLLRSNLSSLDVYIPGNRKILIQDAEASEWRYQLSFELISSLMSSLCFE